VLLQEERRKRDRHLFVFGSLKKEKKEKKKKEQVSPESETRGSHSTSFLG